MAHDKLNIIARIIHGFVKPERRQRLLALLGKPKRYQDFLDEFLHDPRYFDPRKVLHLDGSDKEASVVLAKLRALGAGQTAYLAGDCGEFGDGTIDNLETLLRACVNSMTDSLVYDLTAGVGYYEGHESFGVLLGSPNQTGE